jgi:hypothetical protein
VVTTKYLAKFQSQRAITRPKIIGPKRNVNLICNLSLYTHIPNIKSISQSIAKLEAQWADPVSLIFHSALRKLITEPSISAFHQVSVHLAKQFQRRRFLEINQPETRIAYGSHIC